MVTLLKVGGVILLLCISPWLLLLAPLLWSGGDASVKVAHTVEDATGDEDTGNGCGWFVFAGLFALLVVLVLAGVAVTMPDDCRTIAINVAMGRCP